MRSTKLRGKKGRVPLCGLRDWESYKRLIHRSGTLLLVSNLIHPIDQKGKSNPPHSLPINRQHILLPHQLTALALPFLFPFFIIFLCSYWSITRQHSNGCSSYCFSLSSLLQVILSPPQVLLGLLILHLHWKNLLQEGMYLAHLAWSSSRSGVNVVQIMDSWLMINMRQPGSKDKWSLAMSSLIDWFVYDWNTIKIFQGLINQILRLSSVDMIFRG